MSEEKKIPTKEDFRDARKLVEAMQNSISSVGTAYKFALIIAAVIAVVSVGYSLWKTSAESDQVYIISNESARLAKRADNTISREDEIVIHLARFHEKFYNLSPNMETIDENIVAALSLADQSAAIIDNRRREQRFYSNLVDNRIERLPSGVYVGNLLGRLLTKHDFDYDQACVVPIDVANSPNRTDILYLQALFAMRQRFISVAICDHYDYMLEMFRYIEKHWPRLADDIEHGNPYIQPDPDRANAIREIMEPHRIGTQMVDQLWPGLRCVMVNDVDSLSAGFELLRTYCGNQVHYLFTGISSPEGTFTTALNLDDPQTVLIPDSAFYEFKPKEAKDYYQLLTLDQLEIGRSYELIVSTLSGLYRYKTQKTLLVVGRYHDTPTVIVDKG